MFGSAILEVVIGVVFIYMLLSLLATTVNELIMTLLLSARGRILERAIMAMLDDDPPPPGENPPQGDSGPGAGAKLAKEFYQHPLIVKLSEHGKDDKPSYISKSYFSKIVTDLLAAKGKAGASFEQIVLAINQLPEGKTKELLLSFANDAARQKEEVQAQLEAFKARLESWYEEMMDRALGWYKRRVQRALLMIGFGMSIFFNADTFNIVHHLFRNPQARAELVAQAEDYRNKMAQEASATLAEKNKEAMVDTIKKGKTAQVDTSQAKLSLLMKLDARKLLRLAKTPEEKAAIHTIDSLNKKITDLISEEVAEASTTAGMGWNVTSLKSLEWKSDFLPSLGQWALYCLGRIPGWCITALAITLGAPFWFDMLNKVVNIRNVGRKPEEKRK